MENLDVNELGMVDITNYQVAVELLSEMDEEDYMCNNDSLPGGGRNYNCNNCGK